MSTTEVPGRPFSVLLREYRIAAAISQEELAERARLSSKTIGALERGERQSPYRDTIELLANALGLSKDEQRELELAARRRRTRSAATSPVRGAARPTAPELPVRDALPLETTSLIGRRRAVETVSALLETSRLVTLAGPGGIGKTRLAVAVARAAGARFAGGARLVELAALEESGMVAVAVATATSVDTGGGAPLDALLAALHQWRGLLVFDNCEHVLSEAAGVATALLERCAGIAILATSREPLRARGERVWRVPALSVPADASDAELDASESAALFVERAVAARPGFALRPGDAEALVAICRRLDGLPLAIELAAARVGTLSLKELARALDDRFRVLVGGERVAAARHQALRTAIAWSYDLLDAVERRVFRQAGVFIDGFTLDALVEVATGGGISEPDAFKALASLIDKSLVVAEIGDAFTRYRMLESTLAFAREMLAESGERDAAGQRHAEYFAAFVRAHAWEMWESPDAQTIIDVAAELENVHGALRFCLDEHRNPALGARLGVESAAIFRRFDRRVEMERRLETLLAQPPGTLETAVEAAANYQLLYSMYAAPERQVEAGRRAVELLGQLDEPARGAHASALLAHVLAVCFGRYDQARPLIDAALGYVHASDDLALLDQVLRLASQALPPDAHAERRRTGAESVALAKASGIDRRIADALITAAEVEFAAQAFDAALRLGREALGVQRRIANRTGLALQLTNVAAYALAAGDVAAAGAAAREAIPLAREAESRLALLLALQHLAGVILVRDDDAQRAAALLGFVDAQFARAGFVRETTERYGYERELATLRARTDADALADAFAIGARYTDTRAIDEACR